MKKIYLAGGCFWGVEAYFKDIEGVESTLVGYANGNTKDTSYEKLYKTNHAETVEIKYDGKEESLKRILEYFYYIIDPFSINKQGNDIGLQYRSGIFSKDEKDLEFARRFLDQKQKNEDRKIQIRVEKLENFVKAEDYHQDYLDKNPNGYCHINLLDKPNLA
ncbi:peptide-methionine (S)-S-oxide reductase MsrA [Anaerococcus hydrogenalis]|uniref:Peptide methionine sulfoxide reductase MsrA n=2 Tax=Anaerococcus hydrogenalis TaxID=33029 RepID=F0H071_9FIRM|nr:peptide-methionine (S)-S-oxide reductase MsrA [Anaerococcus hydrogenalis]EGC84046.1 peptide-methionine (S)-S-oxide reductase [Anaerococcus hydrogenalis ACS-025-V-Sch4]MDK7694218.1 peptide-methionine (S)-S-oxide reductase MsrA [Anaerococcus hydrogenalis]MDK7695996.1 peptide-methionine (S)-S-oxide reductase MsrA [Anaerococcus hydrogenalis]MDK7707245.1 peptide-methionine (S)-S-oxide reductase MsrA [Anaerococcus hydrogenalis]PMC82271.1 peptide-methionine (S)-S-oxide reductase [Anaerococcus hydr